MLIIIDLQRFFLAPTGRKTKARLYRLKNHVSSEIEKAKKSKKPIVLVEYKDEGPTVDWVRKKVGKYGNVHIVQKSQDNAYHTLRCLFARKGIEVNKLTVCGVNTEYCVGSTLESLIKNGYEVTVPWKAVESCEDRRHQKEYLENLERIGLNVRYK